MQSAFFSPSNAVPGFFPFPFESAWQHNCSDKRHGGGGSVGGIQTKWCCADHLWYDPNRQIQKTGKQTFSPTCHSQNSFTDLLTTRAPHYFLQWGYTVLPVSRPGVWGFLLMMYSSPEPQISSHISGPWSNSWFMSESWVMIQIFLSLWTTFKENTVMSVGCVCERENCKHSTDVGLP